MSTYVAKGIASGKDKLGRRYKTVNGKHVKVDDEETPPKVKSRHHPHKVAASKMLATVFEGAKTPEDNREGVVQLLLDDRFWAWFTNKSIDAGSRLYVATVLLTKLREAYSHSET